MLESQRGYVERQLEAGVPLETIADDLARMGVDVGKARTFVASFGPQVATAGTPVSAFAPAGAGYAPASAAPGTATYAPAQPPLKVLLLALGIGLFAGVVVGLVILGADFHVFFLATPVGLAVGFGLRKLAPGAHDGQAVASAVVGTLAGIFVARYFVWVMAFRDVSRDIAKQFPGQYHAASASKFFWDSRTLSLFVHHPGLSFGWRGALTLAIGVVFAVRLVRAN